MRGRDTARKSTLTVNIVHLFTIDFSEIDFYRESHFAIVWQCRWTCKRRPHKLTEEDTKDDGISLETRYSSSVEKSFPARHDHPIIIAEPPFWNCGNGLHWHVCLCPSSAPPRLMTVITLACVHAYHKTCLTAHVPAVPHPYLRLPQLRARYPYFPNACSTTRVRGTDCSGWAVYPDGGTRVVDGETLVGWSVINVAMLNKALAWDA